MSLWTGFSWFVSDSCFLSFLFSYQVVLLVVHLGRVSPHAVDGQEQIHEGKRSVEPQQIRPGHNKSNLNRNQQENQNYRDVRG